MDLEPYEERIHQMDNEIDIIISEDMRNVSHLTWHSDYMSRFMRLRDRTLEGPCADECPLFSVLLALTPQIEELDLILRVNEWGSLFNINTLGFLYQIPLFERDRDRSMAYMKLRSPMFEGIRNVRTLRTLGGNINILTLPFDNLKHLDIDLVIQNERRSANCMDLAHNYREFPSLESLKIRADFSELCKRNHDSMVHNFLLRVRCSKLKSFIFEVTAHTELRRSGFVRLLRHPHGFDHLIDSLYPVSETLENLKIDISSIVILPFIENMWWVPTMAGFTSLKKLDVPQAFYVPSKANDDLYARHRVIPRPRPQMGVEQFLPPNIQEITIRYCREETFPWLMDIARNSRQFLHLKSINVHFRCCGTSGVHMEFYRSFQNSKILKELTDRGIQVHLMEAHEDLPDGGPEDSG
jgi:hypothetical protein